MAILKGNEYHLSGDYPNDTDIPKKENTVIKSSSLDPINETIVIGEVSHNDSSGDSFSDSSGSFFDDNNDVSSDFGNETFDSSPAFDQVEAPTETQQSSIADLQPYIDDLSNAINGLKSSRDQVIQSAESGLVDLALEIASKVINKAVEMDQTIIKGIVEDTFNKISGSDRVTFKVNPADLESFNSYQTYFESRLVGVDKISVQQDQTIDPGGCIIETDLGFVDVTIKEKLNIITQAFNKVNASS